MTSQIFPRDPRTGLIDAPISTTSNSELPQIVARLRTAQAPWAAHTIEERSAKLQALRGAIEGHGDAIATALERDTGRRAIARQEVSGVLSSLTAWAAQAGSLLESTWVNGRAMPAVRHGAQFHPYSLVGVISPWNFPLTLSMIDTIPALLAGCAVIVKPSEVTPRFAAPLQEAVMHAGFGDLLQFIIGAGDVGASLVNVVDAVCFTGSVETGRKVSVACAERLIPAFLELGGKDPLIILNSADLEIASTAALRGSVLATGQACQSIERIYVAHDVHDSFVAKLVHAASSCRFNWPDITRGEIGPIIFERQAEVLRAHLEDAVAQGASILCGGEIEHHGGGLWLAPTVLTNVTHRMRIMREETFGPIMPVMAFNSVEDAIALANDTVFGLSGAVFAGSVGEAEDVGRRLNAGAVSLNDAALTAVFYEAEKQSFGASGLGPSRMGRAGFYRFLRRQALIANTGQPLPLSAFSEDAQR